MMTQIKATQFGFIVPLLALLAACAAETQTTLPDGTMAHRIDCDGTSGGLNYCFERAGKSCGADGYTIVDSEGRVISTSQVADSDMETLVREYETDQNSILVRCGT